VQNAFWWSIKSFKSGCSKRSICKSSYFDEDSFGEILKAAKLVADIDPKILFILQPNYLDMNKGIIEDCLRYQKLCAKILKDVRILLKCIS